MCAKPHLQIIVAAESVIIRRGLVALSQSSSRVQVLGEVGGLVEAQALCSQASPDLLILYASEFTEAICQATDELRQLYPELKILLINDLGKLSEDSVLLSDPLISCIPLLASESEFSLALHSLGAIQIENSRMAPSRGLTSRSNSSMAEELAMAGKIQSNILPEKVPVIPGWDIAARLLPARETSGDFYDFIPVTDHNWGVVIADVADKGMGAALFMTLTSTLFRGFAARHPTLPGLTLDTVNERILSDTRGSMFVTAFFCVFEPHTGRMRYANAGHPPPLLVKSQKGKPLDRLPRTGMALGISANEHWTQKLVTLLPGDCLVLYTDGVVESQDSQGRLFDYRRLQEVVQKVIGRPAVTIIDSILTEVRRFTSNAPQQDDIAIVVIRRKTS